MRPSIFADADVAADIADIFRGEQRVGFSARRPCRQRPTDR